MYVNYKVGMNSQGGSWTLPRLQYSFRSLGEAMEKFQELKGQAAPLPNDYREPKIVFVIKEEMVALFDGFVPNSKERNWEKLCEGDVMEELDE